MSKDILFSKYVWPPFPCPCISSVHSFLVSSEEGTRGIKAQVIQAQLQRCVAPADMQKKCML